MTIGNLARKSLRFYFRSHLGTVFGAAIATAVLTGALLVGDSVRGSLREMALARLGKIDFALAGGDRLFRAELANEIEIQLPGSQVAPVLQMPGTAINPDGTARANQVQVTGVDARFFKLADQAPAGAISDNSVWINTRLAHQLKIQTGQTLLLRVPRVSNLSRDAPLSPEENAAVALRLEIKGIVSDAEFGRFGLTASQVPPLNAFVPLALLQNRVNATNQANVLLVDARQGCDVAQYENEMEKAFSLPDAQLILKPIGLNKELELRSSRVFLDDQVSAAGLNAATNAEPVLTYFVNQFRLRDQTTPYSMVTGTRSILPAGMRDDEMIINQWLADDLQAKPGDQITITYYVMGLMRDLVERTNSFRVREIVPMELPYADSAFMPDFPGMTDAQNCRDWDTGFPIKTDAIRPKDEEYWHKYRGAPKAFITLQAAGQMWSNRFGNLTAVRYPHTSPADESAVSHEILKKLRPRDLGLVFQQARAEALSSSAGAQDFGGLFIGFSFFLIVAALILTSLLFKFALEQRGVEIGTLLALGFVPGKIRRLLLLEGFGLAVIGGVIGVAAAVLYARAMVYGLSTIWSGAVAGANLTYFGASQTLLVGFASGILIALLTIGWSLRRETKRTAREMLAEGFQEENASAGRSKQKSFIKSAIAGFVALGLGLATAGWGLFAEEQASADTFFSAGGLVLIAGLFLSSAYIRRLEFSSMAEHLSLAGMGVRSIVRRRKRSRAAIGLLACGSFLIASIGAFHLDAGKETEARESGTGGFALIGESSLPIVQNLNARSGRDFFGLNERDLENVNFVPLRVLPGEDASCLNLNRAVKPRLLGVNSALLKERHAFTFSKVIDGTPSDGWLLLNRDLGPNVVPAIGDAASIQWALGKKIGDTLAYLDANGREFRVKIVGAVANSILQGSLLISEEQFIKRFPTEAGYRMFLIDAPSNRAESVAGVLTKAMQDAGFEATSARERLAAFNAVQNTYLGTFQMLGGLGLLLGSFGLGVILLRNVFERRGELALLLAVGFRKRDLRRLILSEHAALLLIGLTVGVIAAIIAVLPSVVKPGTHLPYAQLVFTLGAVFLCGLTWTIIAAVRALRAPLLQSLRNE